MVLHQAVDMIDEWTLLFTMYTTLQTLRGNCKLYCMEIAGFENMFSFMGDIKV